jgi:hypothetical protein
VVILARQYHETCSRQVDLRVDLSADENGKAVHEQPSHRGYDDRLNSRFHANKSSCQKLREVNRRNKSRAASGLTVPPHKTSVVIEVVTTFSSFQVP